MLNLKDKFLFVDEYENHWVVHWVFTKDGDCSSAKIWAVEFKGDGNLNLPVPPKHLPEPLLEEMEFELGLVIEKQTEIDCRSIGIERKK